MSDLPDSWVRLPLSEVAQMALGKMLDKMKHRSGRELPYLRNQNVRWEYVDTSDLFKMFFEDDELDRYGLVMGDVLVCEGGEPGRAAIWDGRDADIKYQKALHRVRPGPALLPEWLVYYLKHDAGHGALDEYLSGTTIKHFTGASLATYELSLPSPAEQRRIVDKIKTLTAKSRSAKAELDAIPALLERFRQSVLAAAFRGDLTAGWREKNPGVEPAEELLKRIRAERRRRWEEAELAKMRAKGKAPGDDRWKERYEEPAPVDASELPDLPKGWAWATWGQVGLCQNGRPFPSSEYASSGVKLLRPGNLHVDGSLKWTNDNTKYLPEQWAEENPDHIIGGDELVMNLTAQSLKDEFLGRVCLSLPGERCLLNQRLARLTPLMLPARFCLWLFKAPFVRAYIDELNTGSLIQHMFTSQVERFALPIPSAAEQVEIVRRVGMILGAASRTRECLQGEIARLEEMDRSILAKAFRGELVPQDPADEPASVLLERLRAERTAAAAAPNGRAKPQARAGKPARKTRKP